MDLVSPARLRAELTWASTSAPSADLSKSCCRVSIQPDSKQVQAHISVGKHGPSESNSFLAVCKTTLEGLSLNDKITHIYFEMWET